MTTAGWIRKFVTSHPDYKQDSYVSEEIAHDLLKASHDIGRGARHCPDLLGNQIVDPIEIQDAYGTDLKGKLSAAERAVLMGKMIDRALWRKKEVNRIRADSVCESSKSNVSVAGISGGNLARGAFPLSYSSTQDEESTSNVTGGGVFTKLSSTKRSNSFW